MRLPALGTLENHLQIHFGTGVIAPVQLAISLSVCSDGCESLAPERVPQGRGWASSVRKTIQYKRPYCFCNKICKKQGLYLVFLADEDTQESA